MMSDHLDLPLQPDHKTVSTTGSQSNWGEAKLGKETTNSALKNSFHVSHSKDELGMLLPGINFSNQRKCHSVVKTYPTEANRDPSRFGQTMSSGQSDIVPTNVLKISSTSPVLNQGNGPMYSSCDKKVMDSNIQELGPHPSQPHEMYSVDALHDAGSGFHEPSSKNHVYSNFGYRILPNHINSFRSNSVCFDTELQRIEGEIMPHTINEDSNQSFSIHEERQEEQKQVFCSHAKIQSNPKTAYKLPYLMSKGGRNQQLSGTSANHASLNCAEGNLKKSKDGSPLWGGLQIQHNLMLRT